MLLSSGFGCRQEQKGLKTFLSSGFGCRQEHLVGLEWAQKKRIRNEYAFFQLLANIILQEPLRLPPELHP